MRPRYYLTKRMLIEEEACQMDDFMRVFGDRMEITEANIVRGFREDLRVNWAVYKFMEDWSFVFNNLREPIAHKRSVMIGRLEQKWIEWEKDHHGWDDPPWYGSEYDQVILTFYQETARMIVFLHRIKRALGINRFNFVDKLQAWHGGGSSAVYATVCCLNTNFEAITPDIVDRAITELQDDLAHATDKDDQKELTQLILGLLKVSEILKEEDNAWFIRSEVDV